MSSRLISDTIAAIPPPDAAARHAVAARQAQLTKPPGSLGRLEDLAGWLAAAQGRETPSVAAKTIIVAAADHGVVAEGVSAYPQSVTEQMLLNFLKGGAAINVLARQAGADLVVADFGVAVDTTVHSAVWDARIGPGTRNMAVEPAMTVHQAAAAIEAGIRLTNAQVGAGAEVIAIGEMGIANTTAAAALTAVFTGLPPADVAGRGTGLNDAGLARKVEVLTRALQLNRPSPHDPLQALAAVGGFEIGGLVGVIIAAAARRTPVVLDGFITGAAALLATALAPSCHPYLLASHRSAEPGHAAALETLGLEPVLDLNLRLGEGTGAALVLQLLESAVAILTAMATFEDAGVDRQ